MVLAKKLAKIFRGYCEDYTVRAASKTRPGLKLVGECKVVQLTGPMSSANLELLRSLLLNQSLVQMRMQTTIDELRSSIEKHVVLGSLSQALWSWRLLLRSRSVCGNFIRRRERQLSVDYLCGWHSHVVKQRDRRRHVAAAAAALCSSAAEREQKQAQNHFCAIVSRMSASVDVLSASLGASSTLRSVSPPVIAPTARSLSPPVIAHETQVCVSPARALNECHLVCAEFCIASWSHLDR